MTGLFEKIFSALRPEEDALPQEERSQVGLHRIGTLLGAALVPFIGLMQAWVNPAAFDPLGARLAIAGLFAGLFAASYLSDAACRHYVLGTWIVLYVLMIWVTTLAALNHFTADYSVELVFAQGALGIALGLGARSTRPVLWFFGTGLLLGAGGLLAAPEPQVSPPILVGGVAMVAFIEIAALRGRLSLRKELSRRESRLRSITENVSEGIYRSTAEEGIVYANQAFADMFGYRDPEEICRVDPDSLYADPSERERRLEVLRETESFDGHEIEFRRKDGSTFTGLLNGAVTREPVPQETFPQEPVSRKEAEENTGKENTGKENTGKDGEEKDREEKDGKVECYDGAITDITERKKQEQALRAAKGRYRALIENFPGGAVFLFDEDLRYTLAGGQGLDEVGLSASDVEGARPQDLFPDDIARKTAEYYRRAWAGEKHVFEQKLQGRCYRIQVLPVRDETDVIIAGMAVSQDVTEQKKRERKLERQNDLFERAQRIAGIGAWQYDVRSGETSMMTDEAYRIHGLPPSAELSPGQSIEFYHPDDRPAVREAFAEAVQEGKSYDLQLRLIPEDGDRRWVRIRGEPHTEDGEVVRVRGTIRDITERKERERALRAAKEELRSTKNFYEQVLEEAPIDIAVFSPEAEVEYVNPQAVGDPETREWIRGRTNEEYCRERGTMDLALGKRRDRVIQTAAQEKQAAELEERIETEEGAVHYLRVHSPVTGLEGEVTSVVAFGIEITDRKEREEALRERQEKLESLYEATNHLLQAEGPEDLSARLTGLVDQALGYRATTIRLARGEELVPVHVTAAVQERMPGRPAYDIDGDSPAAEAYRTGETRSFEDLSAELETMDRGDVRATAYVPMGSRGLISVGSFEAGGIGAFDLRLLEVLASYAALVLGRLKREQELRTAKEKAEEARRDSEEARREAEEARQRAEKARQEAEQAKREAEKASRMKSSLLANMSHEIRTPLTSIIGFAEALGEEAGGLDLPEKSPLPKYAELIEKGGKRLLQTLEGVLNLSKLEAGQMELSEEAVGLATEAERTAEELRPEAKEKGIDLRLETQEVSARADEGGVQIVLRNLLSNAIKYTGEGGRIWVRTYREGGQAVLEVEDSGIGMEPEVAERLFEPFRQASEGFNREYEGTGVGLAVTREATEQMGGTIEVETEEGEGSRFTAWLPKEKKDGEATGS